MVKNRDELVELGLAMPIIKIEGKDFVDCFCHQNYCKREDVFCDRLVPIEEEVIKKSQTLEEVSANLKRRKRKGITKF